MSRRMVGLMSVLAGWCLVLVGTGWAGNPHFVAVTVSCSATDQSITVSGKEAGLGHEDQVHLVLTADSQCVNPGNHEPQAENKDEVLAAGDFPVQNGKALFELTGTATFQPDCSPPMTITYTNIVITDETSGITRNLGDCP